MAWVTDRPGVDALAKLVRDCDALMFGQPALRNAIFSNVRFDRPDTEPVSEGLSLGSLELRGFDRLAFRALPTIDAWTRYKLPIGTPIASKSSQLVRSASGVCIGLAEDNEWQTDFLVGRVMQQTWLELTRANLAVQPMMSLAVLDGLMHHADAHGVKLRAEAIQAVVAQLRRVLPDIGNRRPAFILRFGHAPTPTGRTGRRPLAAVTAVESDGE
jgi:hypothetical protein